MFRPRPSLVVVVTRSVQHRTFSLSAVRATDPLLKRPAIPAITEQNAASTVPNYFYRGDWVLFHPVYSTSEIKAVEVLHRKPTSWSDRVAQGLVRTARGLFDLVSGYKHVDGPPPEGLDLVQLRKRGYVLSETQWLTVRSPIAA